MYNSLWAYPLLLQDSEIMLYTLFNFCIAIFCHCGQRPRIIDAFSIACSTLCLYRELSPLESTTNVIFIVTSSHSFWKLVVLRTSSPKDLRVLFAFKWSRNSLCVDVIKRVGRNNKNKTGNFSLIELVLNFILHGAKGCKDVQVVTSPFASLGLWGLKRRASLSIFFL